MLNLFSLISIRCYFIWPWSLFNLLVFLLVDVIFCGLLTTTDLVEKKTSLSRKSTCLEPKSKCFLKAERFTFEPESGKVEKMLWELALKFDTTEILQTVMDAKLQVQMENHQIFPPKNTVKIQTFKIIIKKISYSDFISSLKYFFLNL